MISAGGEPSLVLSDTSHLIQVLTGSFDDGGITRCRSEIQAGLHGTCWKALAFQNSVAHHPVQLVFDAGNRTHIDLPPDQSSRRSVLLPDRNTTENRLIHLCFQIGMHHGGLFIIAHTCKNRFLKRTSEPYTRVQNDPRSTQRKQQRHPPLLRCLPLTRAASSLRFR